jgi:hypothetical protein
VRKELTDEWQERGVRQGVEYAILTDEITKAWAGLSTREYKTLKGLPARQPATPAATSKKKADGR